MFFNADKNKVFKISSNSHKANFYNDAIFIINTYPMRAQEQLLNMYLIQTYKKSLKDLCIELILNITLFETKNKFILLFNDPKYDKLARLITYGNNLVNGSNILKVALNQKRGW